MHPIAMIQATETIRRALIGSGPDAPAPTHRRASAAAVPERPRSAATRRRLGKRPVGAPQKAARA